MSSQDDTNNSMRAEHGAAIASTHHTEHSKLLPWLMLCAMFSGGSIVGCMLTFYVLRDRVVDAEVQTQLLEHYVTGLDSTLIAMGMRKEGQDFEKYRHEHLKRAQE